MAYNIMTFGVDGVDANTLQNGNQQLNGNVGPNELTAANLINTNGIAFQQLLLFVGAANNGDLNINVGETAFNLSDMGAGGAVVSLGVTNNNDPIKIRANGLTSANTVGDLTANVYFDNALGFGLANVRDKTAGSSWLNSGDSLTFTTMAINGVSQYLASASFVVNVNGGASEHVVIDFDGNVVRQSGTTTAVDGIDLGLVANGATVSINFALHTISIGAITRAMTGAEISLFEQAGLNQITIGSLNTSTQGFAIKNLTILATDTPVSGAVVHAPASGGETHGTANDDVLIGSAVGDVLNAGAGNDIVYGGAGNDTINAGDGNDRVDGGDGNDIINTGSGANVVSGGAGNDIMQTQIDAAPDIIDGGSGVDQAIVTANGAGDTYVIAPYTLGGVTYAGVNAQSTAGIDVSTTNVEEIVLHAGAGADTIIVQGDLSTAGVAQSTLFLYGGDGDDGIDGSALAGVPPTELEIYGEAGNDTLTGAGNNDVLDGGAGDDTLIGRGGNDTLTGGDGNDFLRGDANANDLTAGGDDVIYGGNGDDVMWGGDGTDTFYGGAGFDRVSFAFRAATQGVVASLITQQISNDGFGHAETMTSVEGLGLGTRFADWFEGNDLANFFYGNAGDTLIGNGGDDLFVLATAPASLSGGDGVDTIVQFQDFTWVGDGNSDGLADVVFADHGVSVDMSSAGNKIIDDGFGGSGNFSGIENVGGGIYDDTIIGDGAANVLTGYEGDDYLDGGAGTDTVNYEENIPLGGSVSSRTEGVFVDLGAGFAGALSGGETDTLISIENAIGTSFGDSITGSNVNNLLTGGDGDDTLIGRGGNDTLTGGDGNDFLRGDANANDQSAGGDDVIYGGNGDDVMWGGDGTDTFYGGAGFDRVSFAFRAATQGVVASLITQQISNDGFGHAETMTSVEGLGGDTRFADWFEGNDLSNFLAGGAGGDTLIGNGGDDYFYLTGAPGSLSGGDGVDTILYFQELTWVGDGNSDGLADVVFADHGVSVDMSSAGNKIIDDGFGGSGNFSGIENVGGGIYDDTIIGDGAANVLTGYEGNDYLDGGAGIDTVNYEENIALVGFVSSRTEGVGVDLTAGVGGTISGGETDTLVSIENVIGTAFDDEIFGDALANVLSGQGGADIISGNAGDDTIYGGDGDDTLNGGDGVDTIYGGAGNDFIILQRPNNPNAGFGEFAYGGDGDDAFRSSSGNDLIDGGNGTDRVTYFAITGAAVHVDLTIEGVGNAQDTGGGGVDTLVSIENVSGTDLFGDTLIGNDGDNLINGNGGSDTLTGGGGADTFVFITAGGPGDIDHITDFSVIDDSISLDSGIFGLAPGALSADAFHIGSAAADADDRIIYDSVTGALWYDADGSGAGAAIQFAILGAGLALASDDFIIVGP